MVANRTVHVRRTGPALLPDRARVLIRPFHPGSDESARRIVARVAALPEEEVHRLLRQVLGEFGDRHAQTEEFLHRRFQQVRSYLEEVGLGCPFCQRVLDLLPDPFTMTELQQALDAARAQGDPADPVADRAARGIVLLAESNYEVQFAPSRRVSQGAIFPATPSQRNGIEDARFVRFRHEDGAHTYYATYTAYDGKIILPQLLETPDFVHFKFSTLNGRAVQNKGMALFPRKIHGLYTMLSRQDDQHIFLMHSEHLHFWYEPRALLEPRQPWELLKIGNCGSPIETEAGWLVLSHGVGPMRKYCLGAFLLDREDPSKVVGRLREPLLSPNELEREGYVPNVLYTCGALVHDGVLILPYAMSDYATSFAAVSLDELLAAME